MGLLSDKYQVEARFGQFGDSATLDAILVHGLLQTYHRLGNSIGGTRWNSYLTWVLWNLISIYFETMLASVHDLRQTYHRLINRLEIVLILPQDRCTVCTKRTIGS
jgi:hypothetical protein